MEIHSSIFSIFTGFSNFDVQWLHEWEVSAYSISKVWEWALLSLNVEIIENHPCSGRLLRCNNTRYLHKIPYMVNQVIKNHSNKHTYLILEMKTVIKRVDRSKKDTIFYYDREHHVIVILYLICLLIRFLLDEWTSYTIKLNRLVRRFSLYIGNIWHDMTWHLTDEANAWWNKSWILNI